MTLTLWTVSGAPSPWRVALGMAFKGIESETRLLSASRREHKSESYLKLNDRGTVPTLESGGLALGHSVAILAWLDRAYPDAPLFGETPEDAGRIWQIAMDIFDHLPPATSGVLGPIFFNGVREATDALQEAVGRLRAELARLTAILEDTPYLGGAHAGAPDAIAFPHVRLLQRAIDTQPKLMAALGLGELKVVSPQLADWVVRIEALPGVAETFPPHWAEVA
ncbi:MAG: glutathione S-transferase family protein [Pseudomonadota bacterium]